MTRWSLFLQTFSLLHHFLGLYCRRKAEDHPPDASLLLDIYPVVSEHKLMAYLHPGEGHQDGLERVLQQHPEITFIVHGEETENAIGDLMARYPNIYYTVNELHGRRYLLRPGESKDAFFDALKEYEPLLEKDLVT